MIKCDKKNWPFYLQILCGFIYSWKCTECCHSLRWCITINPRVMAHMDYMDPGVLFLGKASKLNHSLTHSYWWLSATLQYTLELLQSCTKSSILYISNPQTWKFSEWFFFMNSIIHFIFLWWSEFPHSCVIKLIVGDTISYTWTWKVFIWQQKKCKHGPR